MTAPYAAAPLALFARLVVCFPGISRLLILTCRRGEKGLMSRARRVSVTGKKGVRVRRFFFFFGAWGWLRVTAGHR